MSMLKMKANNCYGIKSIDFEIKNNGKAIIYSPNGTMKSSFARLFSNFKNAEPPEDRIFHNTALYKIEYDDVIEEYDGEKDDFISGDSSDRFYVINSFEDNFLFNKECVGSLLVDDANKKKYDECVAKFQNTINNFTGHFSEISGFANKDVKTKIEAICGTYNAEWIDLIEKLKTISEEYRSSYDFSKLDFNVLFSEKAQGLISDPDFIANIQAYTERLNEIIDSSEILTRDFDDRNVDKLSRALNDNNLFRAEHAIILRNGEKVETLDAWNELIDNENKRLLADTSLKKIYEKIQKDLNKNNDVSALKDLILSNPDVIPYLSDIDKLKNGFVAYYLNSLDRPFANYYDDVIKYKDDIKAIYAEANKQSSKWENALNIFKSRFKVPYVLRIENKAEFCLKEESPHIVFDYSRGEEHATLEQDALMNCLSLGEQRALYILYTIFNLEELKQKSTTGSQRYLVIADDISDSFDYKNKYAIIEYLSDIAKEYRNIDLLMLTHNFDFYRNAVSRLGIKRENCLIAQGKNGNINVEGFKYLKDYFANVVLVELAKDNTENKIQYLISSIPFFRNISNYRMDEDAGLKFTCLLHLKASPIDIKNISINEVILLINSQIVQSKQIKPFSDDKYLEALYKAADEILLDNDDIALENKLILSMASRLKAEEFMHSRTEKHGGALNESNSNQTLDWFKETKKFLSEDEIAVIDELNMITPENIHVNSFMYEPLIDISIWNLKDLYKKIGELSP